MSLFSPARWPSNSKTKQVEAGESYFGLVNF